MYDRQLALEILHQIHNATQIITKRFQPIQNVDDFLDSDAGLEKLDAICMQLIAIGEALKNLDKVTQNSLLYQYPGIEWKKIKGLRDIITHHYFDLDAEIVFDVCYRHINPLGEVIQEIIKDLSASPN